MDTFVCSSWYYLRYADPQNGKEFAVRDKLKKWLPVDVYVGGAEHTVLHLLYSRFFTKALQKFGLLDFNEPFQKLRHQGTILAEDGTKMSKSKGNVINPDEVVAGYGADALRMYEMFMGPLEDMKPWNTKGIVGVRRFIEKIWRLTSSVEHRASSVAAPPRRAAGGETRRLLHKTLKKVTKDIELYKFNTAIAQMMIYVNALEKEKEIAKDDFEKFLLALSPFAPHLAEELWRQLGHRQSIFKQSWPVYDPKLAKDETVELVLQVNGKVRDSARVPADISEAEAKKLALGSKKIKKWLAGQAVAKVIFVPGRLVNVVVK
jgi:leucyl-tRNA synthetase